MKYIITCNENSKQHLIDELNFHQIKADLKWFNHTEALLDIDADLESFTKMHTNLPLIFIRHYFKVDGTLPLEIAEKLSDTVTFTNEIFSIQLRSPQEIRKHLTQMRNQWVDAILDKGNTLDVKNPEVVISVYATDEVLYYGIASIDDLPSRWSAGEIHFSKKIDSISRAEFKLREIFDTFPLRPVGYVAVDLGAAPGGWTRVLHEMEYEVYAIDPAELDFRLVDVEGIHHYAMTSQDFIEANPYFECDILVNDMKMDAKVSISLFKEAAKQLNKDGIGIITIKLSKDYNYNDVIDAMNRMRHNFEILYARQLFHNRNEFTIIVSPF